MFSNEDIQGLIEDTVKAGGSSAAAVEMAKLMILRDIRNLLVPIADWCKIKDVLP